MTLSYNECIEYNGSECSIYIYIYSLYTLLNVFVVIIIHERIHELSCVYSYMYMCMYVCMCMCICICIYTYICMYNARHACVGVGIALYMKTRLILL